jgi:hypothetical protein
MTMRYISIHKATTSMEAGEPPSQAVMEGMGPLMGDMIEKGIFLAGEGLRPSSLGARLTFSNGQRTGLTHGPLRGSNELTAAFSIVRVATLNDAIEWASRFASVSGESEIDVRPVTENWHLGFEPPPPPGSPARFMIIRKADKDSEAGKRVAISDALDDTRKAGVLVAAEILQPSSTGVRLKFRDGKRQIVDGPFTESKELIAGYSIMELSSRDEALQWSDRFAALIGDVEMDIRPLYD